MSDPEARTQTVSHPSTHLLNIKDTAPGSLRFCYASLILQTLANLIPNNSPRDMLWKVGGNKSTFCY